MRMGARPAETNGRIHADAIGILSLRSWRQRRSSLIQGGRPLRQKTNETQPMIISAAGQLLFAIVAVIVPHFEASVLHGQV
jgi:hypothetical protein